MMWRHNGMGWSGWTVMALTVPTFWSLVVFGVMAIVRGDRESRIGQRREPDPMRALDERLARGNIDLGVSRPPRRAARASLTTA